MYYESTRGGLKGVPSAEAIKRGIAPDGGLFVPEGNVTITLEQIDEMVNMSYQERAVCVLKYFLDDFTLEEIRDCVNNAYTVEKFGNNDIAPVRKLNDNVYILELWHGPTCAFKDMALQILPHLLVKAVRKTGEEDEIVILVATSGDTGKAALEGFRDVGGTKIIVFFPNKGVSEIQKMQMVTQEGSNVFSIAVEGNFDDAQNGVKSIFTDPDLKKSMQEKGYKFSSANSINWGRLVPQIVYYFSAYADMVKHAEIKTGNKVNIVVPTGNFGNILAAYYAMNMGLPVNKLICASNVNNVLTDFINTGTYDRRREFKKTISPSMDILVSSNLERLLFEMSGRDSRQINQWMDELKKNGTYTVSEEIGSKVKKTFWAEYCNEKETLNTIRCINEDYGYVIDTHTAVGVDVYDKYVISTGDMTKTIIASTASPFKFNESVARAVLEEDMIEDKSEFELLELLSAECKLDIPEGLKGLDKKEIKHRTVCDKDDMKKEVEKILGILE
jgi:threonine synthase